MKVAVVGSRSLSVTDLKEYLPEATSEIISGGAAGVDMSAREYAENSGIALVEFLPDYKKYGRQAPLYRNIEIIKASDTVFAFWDGRSAGTRFVIEQCKKMGRSISVFCFDEATRSYFPR